MIKASQPSSNLKLSSLGDSVESCKCNSIIFQKFITKYFTVILT